MFLTRGRKKGAAENWLDRALWKEKFFLPPRSFKPCCVPADVLKDRAQGLPGVSAQAVQPLRMEHGLPRALLPAVLAQWWIIQLAAYVLPLRWLVVRGARTRHVFRFIGFIFKIRILLPALFLTPFPQLCQVIYWHEPFGWTNWKRFQCKIFCVMH